MLTCELNLRRNIRGRHQRYLMIFMISALRGTRLSIPKSLSTLLTPPRQDVSHIVASDESQWSPLQFQLVMSEVKTFHLMALSRTARDLIALTIRCFHAKKCAGACSFLPISCHPVQRSCRRVPRKNEKMRLLSLGTFHHLEC